MFRTAIIQLIQNYAYMEFGCFMTQPSIDKLVATIDAMYDEKAKAPAEPTPRICECCWQPIEGEYETVPGGMIVHRGKCPQKEKPCQE